jgi:hypothetical protein
MAKIKDRQLCETLERADQTLKPYRQRRRALYERKVANARANPKNLPHLRNTPVNLIEMAARAYQMHLVVRSPAVIVDTDSQQLKAEAYELQLDINNTIREINLAKTLRNASLDAMFSPMSVVKVALCPPEQDEMLGYEHDAGMPYADPVYFDDFLFDTDAREWDQADFFADRYRVTADSVLRNPMISAEGKKMVRGHDKETQKHPEGTTSDERTDTMMTTRESNDHSIADHVWLIDVYIPSEQMIRTYLWDNGIEKKRPLWTYEWDGPERGPYHCLQYGDLPGGLLVAPVAADWAPLHDAVNSLMRKTIQQAKRQKNILGVLGDAGDDARRINQAKDGEAIAVRTPRGVEEKRYGGPDNQVIGTTMNLIESFKQNAGNLNSLGGLGASADTASQDKIIAEQSSKLLRDMQGRVHDFTKSIVKSIAHMTYHDPVSERTVTKSVGGTVIVSNYGPERREAEFMEYNLDIVPHSMEDRTPQEQAARLEQTMQTVTALAPFIQQLGGTIRADEFLNELARLLDAPVIGQLVDFAEPAIDPQTDKPIKGAAPAGGPAPARRYEHISRAGDSAKSAEQQALQMLQTMGSNEGD